MLVRYNPEGDAEMNAAQAARLKRLADWLHDNGRRFLFELLVPAEPAQLAGVGGDADRYDRELRPGLMVRAIAELQDAGIEADVWKIEGLDAREDCERVAEQHAPRWTRRRRAASCSAAAATRTRSIHWLQTAAGVPGYIGFAVGRTIWWDALKAWLAGEADKEAAADRIAGNYQRLVDAYTGAV